MKKSELQEIKEIKSKFKQSDVNEIIKSLLNLYTKDELSEMGIDISTRSKRKVKSTGKIKRYDKPKQEITTLKGFKKALEIVLEEAYISLYKDISARFPDPFSTAHISAMKKLKHYDISYFKTDIKPKLKTLSKTLSVRRKETFIKTWVKSTRQNFGNVGKVSVIYVNDNGEYYLTSENAPYRVQFSKMITEIKTLLKAKSSDEISAMIQAGLLSLELLYDKETDDEIYMFLMEIIFFLKGEDYYKYLQFTPLESYKRELERYKYKDYEARESIK